MHTSAGDMFYWDKESIRLYKASIGKIITGIALDTNTGNSVLRFEFLDNAHICIMDDGQACCESRYMTTDDNLAEFVGATFVEMEIKEAPDISDDSGESHEVLFLDVNTSKGTFTISTHNEHNGYYGGFDIKIVE